MRYHKRHAKDVAKPSALLLAQALAPHVSGRPLKRLLRYLTEHIQTSIRAYCEFTPARIPAPSVN